MTDLAEPATTTIAADEQLRRIQQLQRKRGVGAAQTSSPSMQARQTPTHPVPSTTRRRSRPHPAIGARVGAAGLGLVTMFGLIAGMGLAKPNTASGAPAPVAAAPAEVVVVIHRTPAATVPPTVAETPIAAAAPAPSTIESATIESATPESATPAAAPITLTARPVVRAAAPAQSNAAPTATTNGSR